MEQLRDLLSEPIDEQLDIMPIKIIKNLYAGCMNQGQFSMYSCGFVLNCFQCTRFFDNFFFSLSLVHTIAEVIEERGEKPLFVLLQQLGGWPMLTGLNWDGSHWTWTDTIARMKKMGVGFDQIISVSVTNDFMNSSKRIIYVSFE